MVNNAHMEQHNKITQRHPTTGAQPSEQTANAANKGGQQAQLSQINELLYKLVENNVAYAGEQFGENLRFNSEVLTNVLYDNIKKVLEEKIETGEFAEWLADNLIQNGCICKEASLVNDGSKNDDASLGGGSESNVGLDQEIIYSIDEKAHQELIDKIQATIVLIQANKSDILKKLSDIDEQVKNLGSSPSNQSLMIGQDKEIQGLIDTIQSNQENIQIYKETHEQAKQEFAEKIFSFNKKLDEFAASQKQTQPLDGKFTVQAQGLLNKIGKNWQYQQEQINKLHDKLSDIGEKIESSPKKQMQKLFSPIQGFNIGGGNLLQQKAQQVVKGKLGNSILSSSSNLLQQKTQQVVKGKLGNSIFPGGIKQSQKNIAGLSKKKKRKSLISQKITSKTSKGARIKRITKIKKFSLGQRIKSKIRNKLSNVKKKISNSIIGKGFRAITKSVKFITKAIKGVVKVAIKTVKFTWNATKFIAKKFLSAAKFTGKAAVKVGKAISKGIINTVKGITKQVKREGAQALIGIVFNGTAMSKLGWKAIKFIGKSIWKGIKKLAFKAFSFFKVLFKFAGKFVNKIGHWFAIVGHGLVDKSYKFLVKPLASLMMNVFGVVQQMVLSPIQFIKWLIPTIVDKILDVLSNISQAVKSVLKATYSIFKRILTNPITIALLVGGLFFCLWKWLGPKLSDGINSIKETVIPMIKSFVSKLVKFAVGLWKVINVVGKYIVKLVDKITDPDGVIVGFVTKVVKLFFELKNKIKELMELSGKNTIDVLCMFLSGDTIGIVLASLQGIVKKLWNNIRKYKLVAWALGIVRTMISLGKLVWSLGTALWRSLTGGLKKLISGDFDEIIDAICEPWIDIWNQIKSLFSTNEVGEALADTKREYALTDPTEDNSNIANEARIAVRSLNMKGTGKGRDNIDYFNKLQTMMHGAQYGDLLPRIQKMDELYQENSKQVAAYDEFLVNTWEIGKGGPDVAQVLIKEMLESPEISQKLLSVFFYYNPQTGQTQMLRPTSYIDQFLNNIRKMVSDDPVRRDDAKTLCTLIEAFDQLNKERSYIINNQGKVIADFANKLADYDRKNDTDNTKSKEITDIIQTFNKGDLFSAATAKSSFEQIKDGRAKTEQIESVTGNTLGTNQLLKVEELKTTSGQASLNDSDFVMPESAKEPPSRDTIGNVILPPGSNPPPPVDVIEEDKSIGERWREHQEKRNHFINQGHTDKEAHEAGLDDMTLDEFKQQYKKMRTPPELSEKEQDNKNKRAAALRNASMISSFHNQGTVANKDGFKFTGRPSILQIETDGLSQYLYMFSPEWMRYYNASELDEDELLLKIDDDDQQARERIRKKKEAAQRKKAEEEAQRRREQEILDYSAKVDGGFIEVKIGEDTQAMSDAWAMHMKKRNEFINAGHTDKEADAAGLKDYTWEAWQRYYRKMHGLPEDGIKRIPFEGKKKERQIDWSARYPMSVDELAQYGIEVSEDGPVMIPLDKAMKAASELLANAKTIYSVRDGLEIMRQGLKTETNKLKEKNKNGTPMAIATLGGGDGGAQTQPVEPNQSQYSDVG